MRKFLVPVLLASVAATPSFAQRPDRYDRQESRAERQQQREDRQQAREERREARQESSNNAEVQVRSNDGPSRPEVAGGGDVKRVERAPNHFTGADIHKVEPARTERSARREAGDAVRVQDAGGQKEVRQESVRKRDMREHVRVAPSSESELSAAERQQLREKRIEDREIRQADRRAPIVSRTPVEGSQPPPRTAVRPTSPAKWSTSWRHSSKYDWWNWRKRNSWLFHLGYYNDPFGWGYRPYSIGWRMWPSYYSSSYWLSDPWDYRLPYAPPGYRWIRYYDDAILIDTWNGQIVDVIYNFFW